MTDFAGARRDRGGRADGVGAADRRAGPATPATSAWPRNWPRTRWSRRSSSGRARASRATPGAWLMTVAKRRAIDLFRRNRELRRKYAQIGRALEAERRRPSTPDFDRAFADDIDDDLLRLVFTACHPVLSVPGPGRADPAAARRPHHRRDRPGLPGPGADDRAAHRAGQEDAGQARVPFEVPGRRERPARLSSVLEVIYLIFNEGYSATAGRRLDAPRAVRRTRCGWAGCWPGSCPTSPRCTAWWR